MSSSSDSEDDETMKRFFEATDTSLLTNAMFKHKSSPTDHLSSQNPSVEFKISERSEQKSQRYLDETDFDIGTDISISETVRDHFSKKLTNKLDDQIEFCFPIDSSKPQKKPKSKVKLLLGTDCYVKPYDEFEYEFKGPEKKPEIKRRKLSEECEISEQEKLMSAVVNWNDILDGIEVKSWAKKPEKSNKFFCYKMATDSKTLHVKEKPNEFTKMRLKNKWNESKIKQR